jgi:hypothetical protein
MKSKILAGVALAFLMDASSIVNAQGFRKHRHHLHEPGKGQTNKGGAQHPDLI